jgi:transcriptional regulator with XRE-family HTH domain
MTPTDFRVWRRDAGLTQEQLANLLFVSRRTIIDWEAGVTAVPENIERETRRRSFHRPATVFWHTAPFVRGPGHRITRLQTEHFDTVNQALDRACELVGTREAFTAHVIDDGTHEMLWDLPSLWREFRRRHPKGPRRLRAS